MSRLLPFTRFNQPPRMSISLPHPSEAVLFHVTIVVLKDGKIDLVGHIGDRALAEHIIRDGMARLLQWHAGRIAVPMNGDLAPPALTMGEASVQKDDAER
jgi:hypothetical protein